MTFEHAEHKKWTTKRAPTMTEYMKGVKGMLDDSAARGFSKPPANVLGNIVEAGKITKLKLAGANGEVYQEQVGIMFQQEEFDSKMALEYLTLALATYVQDLLNALALENAQMDEAFKTDRAYVDKLKADVDKRNYDLMIDKANIDSQLIDYRTREVEAAREGIAKELELITAQIETAEERLKIITWLNQLIIKEQAILELEEQKAVVLQAIIAIQEDLAAIKESMIPFYEEKADAKMQQATAITDEIEWKEALINLGFDKIDLRTAEVAADITENEQKKLLEQYQLDLIKKNNALTTAKSEYGVLLTQYSSAIARQVIALQEIIKKAAVDLRLDTRMDRFTVDIENDTELKEDTTTNMNTEIDSTINKILNIANTVKKSESKNDNETLALSYAYRAITQKIQ